MNISFSWNFYGSHGYKFFYWVDIYSFYVDNVTYIFIASLGFETGLLCHKVKNNGDNLIFSTPVLKFKYIVLLNKNRANPVKDLIRVLSFHVSSMNVPFSQNL
jgi:hypothetical protein